MAFDMKSIDYFKTTSYNINTNAKFLYIAIDPSAGKDMSFYAVLSSVFIDGRFVVCFFS
jgi:hypothetical protein